MIMCFYKSCINMIKSSTFTFSPAHNHKCFTDQIISPVMAPTFSFVRKQKLVVKLSKYVPFDRYLYHTISISTGPSEDLKIKGCQ